MVMLKIRVILFQKIVRKRLFNKDVVE